jgi:uncharacterized YigZ family protein
MLPYYATLKEQASTELVVKKSRFIAYARPVHTEEQFSIWLHGMRKQHPLASHHCYAYVIGERNDLQKQSDDGEPSGTAGKPMLEVIKQQALSYAAVVVVRYFGGTELGTGGLVRAYSESCQLGIGVAKKVYQVAHRQVDIRIAYTWHAKLQHEFASKGTRVGETTFTDEVCIQCFPLLHEVDQWLTFIDNVTQGQCVITIKEVVYLTHDELPT